MVLVMLVDMGKMRVENVDYTIKVFLSIAKAWLYCVDLTKLDFCGGGLIYIFF